MLNEMKSGKAPGALDVSLELIAASGGVRIQVMVEICLRVLDEFEMPVRGMVKYGGCNLHWER